MARSRLEILEEEEAQSQAERARFEELADQYRQQSHLPPGGDQSWREREAMRRAAYDAGYAPPPGDPLWREREDAQAAEHEPVQEPAEEPVREEDFAGRVAEDHAAPPEPVLQPVHVAKGGQGGTVLIFILVAGIALGIAVLAYPELLTANYWRASQANLGAQSPSPRAAEPIHTPAVQPSVPPSPAGNAPQPSAETAPAPDLKRMPADPAPPIREAPPPVPVIDATPSAKPAPAPRRASRSRASAPMAQSEDRGAGGFYAKVPGPDGSLEYQYFRADPKSDQRAPARKEPAVPDVGGFHAKAPGPDGTLQDRYFPRQSPPR
jgi:hypothetical protein